MAMPFACIELVLWRVRLWCRSRTIVVALDSIYMWIKCIDVELICVVYNVIKYCYICATMWLFNVYDGIPNSVVNR